MSYVLAEERPKPDANFEAFVNRIVNQSCVCQTVYVSSETQKNPQKPNVLFPLPSCSICTTSSADGSLNSFRKCKVEETIQKCTGSPCTCPPFRVCVLCYLTLLWKNSNPAMKQQARYKAKCPFCKAEFCHLDLIVNIPSLSSEQGETIYWTSEFKEQVENYVPSYYEFLSSTKNRKKNQPQKTKQKGKKKVK